MKKTLTVNLGGTVYHIDEDAYVLLDNYLKNLRFHFRKEEGADEIVRDMENRIAELFDEYLSLGHQVVTLEQVEQVIARMGKPEDLNAGDEEENRKGETSHDKEEAPRRRIFRNPDDRILGGVASGVAAYFGWDVTWVRILLLVLGFWVHGLFVAYLIAWIIIPVAKTATEKLQMRGEPINVQNIGRTVTDGFERVNDYVRSERPRSFLHNLASGLVSIMGFLIKFCLVVVAICCIPFLFVGLIVLFALLMAATGVIVSVPAFFYHWLPQVDWGLASASPASVVGLSLCGLFAIGIPVVGLFQLIMQSLNVWKPMATSTKVMLIILWMVSVIVGIILGFQMPLWDGHSLIFL